MKKDSIFIGLFAILLLASINTFGQECLFICPDGTPRESELNITLKLEEWGYNVTPISTADLALLFEEDFDAWDFAFASEAVGSSSLAPLKLMPIPLVNSEPWASKPSAFAWCDPATAENISPEPVLIVDDTNHPLAAGYQAGDQVDLVTDPAGLIVTSIPSIDVIYIGASSSDNIKSIIYGIEAGTELTDGDITENRAACIGIHEMGYPSMTEAAFEFIHAAINWVLGIDPSVVEKKSGAPVDFELAQNYPNPFNPVTEIQFSITKSAHTNLTVYNALGQIMETLIDEELNTGKYQVTFNAAALPSGVYFYKIRSGSINGVRKMILMK
jgi:hypothetical protein